MTAAADDNARGTGAMATIQSGIATVFETVAVLGTNLRYVLVGIGTEIGGLAAQVVQAAQLNFSGVAAIREQMVADARTALKDEANMGRLRTLASDLEQMIHSLGAAQPTGATAGSGGARRAGGAPDDVVDVEYTEKN